MMSHRPEEYFIGVVRELRSLPNETEWVEFKVNNSNPDAIGEYISALSNGAALNDEAAAYMVWGVEDETHEFVGTEFSPGKKKKGNEPLDVWLAKSLNPPVNFSFHQLSIDGYKVVLLKIEAATQSPVAFKGERYIRIGSVKKPLTSLPQKEAALWRVLDKKNFEEQIASEWVKDEEVLQKIDYPSYFDLLKRPLPEGRSVILDVLREDGLIKECDAGGWDITNLGAILFARDLAHFPSVNRKVTRVIQYDGTGKTETLREREFVAGYATAFQTVLDYIMTIVPSNEAIEQSLRTTLPMFPETAVRELVANALIHQDFYVTGAGPTIEIFDDRIEITNPGSPLLDVARFVDLPPQSRNEKLASLMRRFGICEERGSGIDKIISLVESFQLPPPLFEAPGNFTRATLFSYKPLASMNQVERIRACYQHACLRYVTNQTMNNTSVRERFGISKENSAQASRLLKEAVEAGEIVIKDSSAGSRSRAYLPHWATSSHRTDQIG